MAALSNRGICCHVLSKGCSRHLRQPRAKFRINVKGNNDSYIMFTDRIICYWHISRDLPAFITRYLPRAYFREEKSRLTL